MHHHESTKTRCLCWNLRINQEKSTRQIVSIFDSAIDGLLATIEARGSDG